MLNLLIMADAHKAPSSHQLSDHPQAVQEKVIDHNEHQQESSSTNETGTANAPVSEISNTPNDDGDEDEDGWFDVLKMYGSANGQQVAQATAVTGEGTVEKGTSVGEHDADPEDDSTPAKKKKKPSCNLQ